MPQDRRFYDAIQGALKATYERDHEEALAINDMIDDYVASLHMEAKADFYGYPDHDMDWHISQARGHMSGPEDRSWL